MIFYGRNSSRLKDGQINNVTCPNCDNNTSMRYAIFGKYAHIYWIPTFPMGKETIVECNTCDKTYKLKELPDSIRQKFEFEKQGANIPVWYFSGAALIVAIIAAIGYSVSKDKENDALYIQDPQVGDVYSLDMDNSSYYSTMKVVEVVGDSVYVVYNNYEINSRVTNEIDKDENYDTEKEGLTKEDLSFYYEEGNIYSVDRD